MCSGVFPSLFAFSPVWRQIWLIDVYSVFTGKAEGVSSGDLWGEQV